MLIAGYDPGGNQGSGVAMLEVSDHARSFVLGNCLSVDEAVAWFKEKAHGRTINSAGIDSPLTWATGRSGWRPMDRFLRSLYPDVRTSVLCTNSSYGSMCIQGPAMALKLKATWKGIQLNETHPKLLCFALVRHTLPIRKDLADHFLGLFGMVIDREVDNEHQWDALVSASATWQGFAGLWRKDLMSEGQDLLFPVGTVSYFWPDLVAN